MLARAGHLVAARQVGLDDLELFVGELARLVQDRQRHKDLAHVVQQPSEGDLGEAVRRHPDLLVDHGADDCHVDRVLEGVVVVDHDRVEAVEGLGGEDFVEHRLDLAAESFHRVDGFVGPLELAGFQGLIDGFRIFADKRGGDIGEHVKGAGELGPGGRLH